MEDYVPEDLESISGFESSQSAREASMYKCVQSGCIRRLERNGLDTSHVGPAADN